MEEHKVEQARARFVCRTWVLGIVPVVVASDAKLVNVGVQMVDVSADVAGQLLTKQYRREKIFGLKQSENPFRAPGSVRASFVDCHE